MDYQRGDTYDRWILNKEPFLQGKKISNTDKDKNTNKKHGDVKGIIYKDTKKVPLIIQSISIKKKNLRGRKNKEDKKYHRLERNYLMLSKFGKKQRYLIKMPQTTRKKLL